METKTYDYIAEAESLFGEVKAKVVPATDEQQSAKEIGLVAEDVSQAGDTKKNGYVCKVFESGEELLTKNVDLLSNDELLSLFLENASEGERVAMAKRLLDDNSGKFSKLFRNKEEEFEHYKSKIGKLGVKRISVAGEIVKRVLKENVHSEIKISSSTELFDAVREMAFLPNEELWLITINSQGFLNNICKLTRGTTTFSLFDPAQICSTVLRQSIKTFAIAHNHPGGTTFPSEQDNDATEKLRIFAQMLELNFIDHLIVYGPKDADYYSYKNDGKL